MNKSGLAILSGLAFAGALLMNGPHVWAQATPGGTSEKKSGSESRAQKPTDPPVTSSKEPGTSSQSGMSRSEGAGTQAGSESRGAGKWSKDKVKAIQEALKTKGFDPGPADGVVGPKTGQALRDFQKSQNLQVTGRIDDKTASALGVEGGMAGSSQPSSKESTIGSRGKSEPSGASPGGASGTGSQSSMQKEKTGSPASESDKPGARGGTTTPPGKQ
jgi:peptidoglycan hydrolase-like protein with peptidoglycan-binding domain